MHAEGCPRWRRALILAPYLNESLRQRLLAFRLCRHPGMQLLGRRRERERERVVRVRVERHPF